MKLRTKFFIIFFLISVVPTLIIATFTYSRCKILIHDQINQACKNLFDNALFFANNRLSSIQDTSEIFTFYSNTDNSIIEDLKKYRKKGNYTSYDIYESNNNIKFLCQNLIYSNDALNGIFIFTPSGAVLGYGYGSNIDIVPDYNPQKNSWYQKTVNLEGKIYIDGISAKDFIIDSKPSISFCKSIYDVYTKDFLGVLFIDYDSSVLNLDSVNTLPELVHLKISTAQGNIINSDYNEDSTNFPKNTKTKDFAAALDYNNLTLNASVNYDALYNNFSTTKNYIIIITIICCICFILLSLILAKYFTAPITFLSSYMTNKKFNKLLQSNRYLKRNDEIGTLFQEYNHMLKEQEQYIKTQYQDRLILLDAQMKSLEAQINSHFLFNTLESINSIAEVEGVSSISDIVLSLGNMFRYSIKTESEIVTLYDELDHINNYVSIQQVRFNNRFRVETDISDSLKKQKVLKLILQPLVENALYHGLKNCTRGDLITVSAKKDNNNLLISVWDNGVGMSEDELNSLQEKLIAPAEFKSLGKRSSRSIGLSNINARIRLYYGHEYGMTVDIAASGGLRITLRLPDQTV